MLYKLKFFIRCIVLNGLKNKLRTVLSIIGIFIGIFFFSYTNILIDSFYNARLQEIENMPQNAGLIYQYSEYSESDYELLKYMVDTKPYFGLCNVTNYIIEHKQLANDVQLNIRANIVGVSEYTPSVVTIEGDDLHIVYNRLIRGRYISSQDNMLENKVIIIDDITAKMLFSDTNPIGAKIRFSKTAGAVISGESTTDNEYEIVGVIRSNYYKQYSEEKIRNKIIKGKEKDLFYNTTVYMPESVMSNFLEGDRLGYALWDYNSKEEYYKKRELLKREANLASLSDGASVFIDENIEKNRIIEEIQNYKDIIMAITIIMCIFSGINNMNIFFFSIKERIREMGIRKSFGATKTDIIFQFVSEGIMVGFIASILAIFVSVILALWTIDIVWSVWEIKLVFEFSIKSIVLPFLIGLLQSIIFTIIPSFYGAKIMITDSLRFD